ncbi:SusC/RagA family TonB-linked outer membrane protein [Aestuariibaculum sp. M13]|uniref:SusC/RagA family TonB-linked outer membrane protein n=1 Tax=Aestuariibaculum sp. M13 TaxID=2967132 RepID=UPI002159E1E7|nr:SusC/RagA family TonB-linked outer membrane protein [Aestuariibaculum sp. M13]MCR8668940.1 SusC/RagA family TonB-linked outer membrane protein [Aestuariibaculum sp. M13]
MRTFFLLFCTTVFSFSPTDGMSQNAFVKIDTDKVLTVDEIFDLIMSQTDYTFIYQVDMFKNFPSVKIEKGTIKVNKLLSKSLSLKDYSFEVASDNQTIIVTEIEQQQLTISGTVTDLNGVSLYGVTVVIKGTKTGVSTNFDGEYKILAKANDTLEFSSIGYQKSTVVVNKQATIDVVLEEDVNILEEVVLVSTGYQEVDKSRATGSYGKVDQSQLDKPSTNIGSRLIGNVAGVQSFVDENGDPEFQIRGQSSLFANEEPLVVVDGFPIQGGLNSVNPNDVESVTVLKDASAASIWGAKSSNGVIVINTKKVSKKTPLKVEFSAFTRMGKKLDLDYVNPLASSSETIDYEIESFNKWRAPLPPPMILNYYFMTYSQAATAMFQNQLGNITEAEKDATLSRLRTLSNKGQISDELLASPISTQYNLSLSGASERMSNALSFMYEDNQTNFQETYNKEYMLNYRTEAKVFKWLDFSASAMLQKNEITSNGVSLSDIQALSPYDMLRDENGDLTNITTNYYWPIIENMVPTELFPYQDWTYNPIQEMNNRSITNEINSARLQAGLRFKIISGLNIDTKLQYESINSNYQAIYNENTFYVRNLVNTSSTWNRSTNEITANLPLGGILSSSGAKTEVFDFRTQVNFNKSFANKHNVNFIGGTEIIDAVTNASSDPIRYGYDPTSMSTGIFPNGPTGTRGWLGASQNFSYSPTFRKATDRFFSIFSNLEYTYNNKYTISGSYRTDASNLITDNPEFRYDPFWSVGMSWQIKNESFLENVNWVDRLTVRGTYGYNGNIDKTTSFKPLISLSSSPNVYTGDYTASISSLGNPTLRWEKTGTWNFGMDFSILKRALYGSVDIYKKEGKDLMANITIPSVNGSTSQKFNNAEMINKGIELSLGTYLKISDNIFWNGNLNFAYNDNKITNLYYENYNAYQMIRGGSSAYVEGENANTLWTWMYGGLDDNGKPTHIDNEGTQYNFTVSSLPGDDINYVENKGTLVAPYTLGFTSAFDIYDFNLSFIVTGKFGHVFKRQSFNYKGLFTSRVLPNSSLTDVRNAEPSEIIPLPTSDQEPTYYLWDRYYPYMNYLVESASHIRMQEINVTYNLPISKLFKSQAKAQVFVQGNNLFTLKSNTYNEDPEYTLGTVKPQPTITLGTKWTF